MITSWLHWPQKVILGFCFHSRRFNSLRDTGPLRDTGLSNASEIRRLMQDRDEWRAAIRDSRVGVGWRPRIAQNSLRPCDASMRQWNRPSLFQIMACHLPNANWLSEPILVYCQWEPMEKLQWNSNQNSYIFIPEMHLKMLNGGHSVSASMC